MEKMIFIDRTESNGKCTLLSSIELPIRWYGKNAIHTHLGKIYKGLTKYHPTKKELEQIEKTHTLTEISLGFFTV